jgi:hypothetical protein
MVAKEDDRKHEDVELWENSDIKICQELFHGG